MAKGKKGGKSGGKKKEDKSSGSGRLESRLLGYWKKGLYGEFVTAFLSNRCGFDAEGLSNSARSLGGSGRFGRLDHLARKGLRAVAGVFDATSLDEVAMSFFGARDAYCGGGTTFRHSFTSQNSVYDLTRREAFDAFVRLHELGVGR